MPIYAGVSSVGECDVTAYFQLPVSQVKSAFWRAGSSAAGIATVAEMARDSKEVSMAGWREFLVLPGLCATPINVKLDTVARTSALHAFGLEVIQLDSHEEARFELHPLQRTAARAVSVSLPVHRYRKVRSSNGRVETRPTVITSARVGETEWPIELTLTSRDSMGFRVLLGRAALRRRFVVNPGRSYLLSTRPTTGGQAP